MYVKPNDHVIPFAEDDAGNACTVPNAAVKLRIKKKRGEGKPGRPKNVCIGGVPFEPELPVTSATVAVLTNGDYIADPIDANGQRVGARVLFSIEHMGPESAQTGPDAPTQLSGVAAELMEMNRRLQAQTEALHEALLKTVNQVCVALEKMTTAQVELTKQIAPLVEAAATTIEAARGGGFSKVAEELRAVWDSMPDTGKSDLETVLTSPLVGGLAYKVQDMVGKIASKAAEAAADYDEPSDNVAARVGRDFCLQQAELERRAANKDK